MKSSFITSCAAALLLACPAAMAQDECASAPVLTSGVASAFNTATATATATPAVDDTLCAGTFLNWLPTQQDVWFQYTATAAGTITVTTCDAASYDTSIVIYSGSCGALTPVACNGDAAADAACQGFYSKVSDLPVSAGTTYFVRVGGYDGEVGAGNLLLTFTQGVDGCAGATGDCAQVHASVGCNVNSCCSAVCAVVPDCCTVTWDQTCVDTAIPTCNIYIYSCNQGVPANDCAINAQAVSASGVYNFSNIGANSDGPPYGNTCQSGNNECNNDVWFKIAVVANGELSASTCGTVGFDSKIAIYDMGTAPASFNYNNLPTSLVNCNDDGPAPCDTTTGTTYASKVAIAAQLGHTYLVCLSTYTAGETGAGQITFTVPVPCVMDTASAFEAEPCGQDLNGGCNSTPNAFEPVFVNTVTEGTFWSSTTQRDTDWYEFSLPADRNVSVSVKSASLVNVLIFGAPCPGSLIATGSGTCPTTATACLNAGTYYVVVVPALFAENPCTGTALNEYSMNITSVAPTTSCPTLVSSTCNAPGPDNYSSQSATWGGGNTLGGLVACAVTPAFPNCGTGGSTANSYARVIPAGSAFDSINCLGVGFFSVVRDANAANTACANYLSDLPLPATVGVYRDINDGTPTRRFLPDGTCPTGDCDLQLIDAKSVLVPGMAAVGQIEFDPPLCLENETNNLVVVLDCPNLYDGSTGSIPAASGYNLRPAGAAVAGQGSNTYCVLSCAAGAGTFVLTESLGATFTAQWIVNVNGTAVGCGGSACFGDVNDDGQVNGADLGLLLGAWGPCNGCPTDLNQDAVVNGADLGLLLGAWGPCAP